MGQSLTVITFYFQEQLSAYSIYIQFSFLEGKQTTVFKYMNSGYRLWTEK